MKYHGDKLLFDDGRTFATLDPGVRQEEVYALIDGTHKVNAIRDLEEDRKRMRAYNDRLQRDLDLAQSQCRKLNEELEELKSSQLFR